MSTGASERSEDAESATGGMIVFVLCETCENIVDELRAQKGHVTCEFCAKASKRFRKNPENRTCKCCKETKNIELFVKGRYNECKQCYARTVRERRKKNKMNQINN